MAMKPHKKAVCTVGTYEKAGETKKRYVNVGTLFKDSEDGRLSLKMDSVPVGQEWNGWVSFFEIEDKRDQSSGSASSGGGGGYAAKENGGGSGGQRDSFPADLSDDIPFISSDSVW